MSSSRAITLAAILAFSTGAIAEEASSPGQALYEAKCGGCHSLDENRVGPRHRGVVGREIASVPGYDYSAALRSLKGPWTVSRLDAWLQNPQAVAPGTKMYLSVTDADDRKNIIAYLAASGTAPASR